MAKPRTDRAALKRAILALLQALSDSELQDVLTGLNAKGVVAVATPVDRPQRPCGTCGLSYPLCRRRWADDHEYEAPAPRKGSPE